jgi:hypothetical protein
MSPQMSTIVSILFLVLGTAAVLTMMIRLGRQSPSRTFLIIHRVAGWSFAILCVVMTTVMAERMTRHPEQLSPLNALHFTLSVLLILLLTIKLVIPRFFPGLSKHLFLLGMSAFLTAFSLVGISAGDYLVHKIRKLPYVAHVDLTDSPLDPQLGKQLSLVRCAPCHIVKDILINKSPKEWEITVNRMVRLASPQITPGEARQILHFLVTDYGSRSQED